MGICGAWAAVYGLRDVGLRALQFFVNCRMAADAHGGPLVRGSPVHRGHAGERRGGSPCGSTMVTDLRQMHCTKAIGSVSKFAYGPERLIERMMSSIISLIFFSSSFITFSIFSADLVMFLH